MSDQRYDAPATAAVATTAAPAVARSPRVGYVPARTNTVRDGIAVGLLDFDFAAPGRVLYDLAQMARMCVPVDDDVSAARLGWQGADRPARLRLVVRQDGQAVT